MYFCDTCANNIYWQPLEGRIRGIRGFSFKCLKFGEEEEEEKESFTYQCGFVGAPSNESFSYRLLHNLEVRNKT